MWSIAASVARLVGLVLSRARPASAQELEPKAYSASPVGATFLVGSVARSAGLDRLRPEPPDHGRRRHHQRGVLRRRHDVRPVREAGPGVRRRPLRLGRHQRAGVRGGADRHAVRPRRHAHQALGEPPRQRRHARSASSSRHRGRPSSAPASRCGRAHRRVRPDQADQPGQPPLGVQAGGRPRGADRPLGHRRLRRGVAVHGQRRLLPGWPGADAGSDPRRPGPRELHLQAAPVAGGRQHVVLGRQGAVSMAESRPWP